MSGDQPCAKFKNEFLSSSIFLLHCHLHVLRHSFVGGETIIDVKPIE